MLLLLVPAGVARPVRSFRLSRRKIQANTGWPINLLGFSILWWGDGCTLSAIIYPKFCLAVTQCCNMKYAFRFLCPFLHHRSFLLETVIETDDKPSESAFRCCWLCIRTPKLHVPPLFTRFCISPSPLGGAQGTAKPSPTVNMFTDQDVPQHSTRALRSLQGRK